MIRRIALLVFPALALVFPVSAIAVPQTAPTSDPADGQPAIDGNPRPDLASVTVTHDSDTATATVIAAFHGATLASAGGDVTSAYLPVSLGKRVGASCSSTAPGSADLAASFSSAAGGYGYLKIAGSSGMVALAPSPTWDAARTSLSWGSTNPALAIAFDCITVGPLYADLRSYASHPTSRYSSGCDCWTVFQRIDDTGEGSLGAIVWFPGREPKATLTPKWTPKSFMATHTAKLEIAASGEAGTDADAKVTWYRGTEQVATETKTITAPQSETFETRLASAGSYRVEVADESGAVVFMRYFNVAPKIGKPVLNSMDATESKAGATVSFVVCAPRGRLRIEVNVARRYDGVTVDRIEKKVRPFHAGGCRTHKASWRSGTLWLGEGSRRYTARSMIATSSSRYSGPT